MGSNAIAIRQTAVDKYEQREYIDTIKQTVCKGASDAQLKMFIEVCRSTGLNPFLKEIWYVAEKGIIMAARDGYLRVANENPQFDGMETRVERDERNVPIKAVCTVWRKDRSHPTTCEAYFSEYQKQSPVWRQYPSAMIGKVAEVLALKRSFAINGVVSEEEIGHDGSADAARQVAESKLAALKQGVPYPEITSVVVDEPPLEEQLRDSVVQAETKRGKKKQASKFDVMNAFGEIKKRYEKIGQKSAYYAVLGKYGHEHCNEFPDTDEGIAQARVAYKEMGLDVAELELKASEANEDAIA